MKFEDKNMVDELVFSFYMLLDKIQNDDSIPVVCKCILLINYLKIIKNEYENIKI